MTDRRVVVVTPEELEGIIESAVLRALEGRAESESPAEWLDAEAAAGLAGVHPRTVLRYVRQGRLPASRVGRLVRIRRADLERFMLEAGE